MPCCMMTAISPTLDRSSQLDGLKLRGEGRLVTRLRGFHFHTERGIVLGNRLSLDILFL